MDHKDRREAPEFPAPASADSRPAAPARRERPDTPCVAVCSTTFDEVCRGCGRTVAEVANWVFMTPEEKDAVWERLTAQGYPKRRG